MRRTACILTRFPRGSSVAKVAISYGLFATCAFLGYVLVAFVMFSVRLDEGALAAMPPPVAAGFVYRMQLPVWLFAHRWAGFLYPVLGLLQFTPQLRRRWPRVHRITGRLFVFNTLVLCSGLALLPPGSNAVYVATRFLEGAFIAASSMVAVSFAIRGRTEAHRRWMTRSFSVGIGQGLVLLILPALTPSGESQAYLPHWSADLLCLGIAELWIRLPGPMRTERSAAFLGGAASVGASSGRFSIGSRMRDA
jgi:uncharacterized membrane protein